jgi:hypothetical protein
MIHGKDVTTVIVFFPFLGGRFDLGARKINKTKKNHESGADVPWRGIVSDRLIIFPLLLLGPPA